jgi:hypothetical protein
MHTLLSGYKLSIPTVRVLQKVEKQRCPFTLEQGSPNYGPRKNCAEMRQLN